MVEINGVPYATLQPCSEPGGRTVEAIARRLILGDNARQLREELTEALDAIEMSPANAAFTLTAEAHKLAVVQRDVRETPRGWCVVQRDLDGMIVAATSPIYYQPTRAMALAASWREFHVRDVATLRQWGLR